DVASIALLGAYGNQPVPLGGYSGTNVPRQSILEALTAAVPGAKVAWAKGVDIAPDEARPAVPAAQLADVRGEYFANRTLQGEPPATQPEATLDFSWDKDPAPGVPPTDFSVRWTGKLLPPQSGEFTVTTTSDDGVRLWLDDQLVIDNWTDHAPTTDTATLPAEQGRPVAFRLEYYQAGGGAVLRLGWGAAGAVDPGLQ